MTHHPIPGFNFKVAFHPPLDNNAIGFLEIIGLELGVSLTKEPKTPKRLILTRGLLPHSEFSQWYTDVLENNKTNFRDLDIILLNRDGKPEAAWKVTQAHPTAWSLDPLHAMENKIAIETLELSYKTLQRTV